LDEEVRLLLAVIFHILVMKHGVVDHLGCVDFAFLLIVAVGRDASLQSLYLQNGTTIRQTVLLHYLVRFILVTILVRLKLIRQHPEHSVVAVDHRCGRAEQSDVST
jgi:hypothetical protein